MILDVYIGSLHDDGFAWDGGNWEGNVPRPKSPYFPDGHRAFWEVRDRISKGIIAGKLTDWGGWVARVKKSQIEALIRDLHDTHPWYQPGSLMPHMEQRLKDLRAYVAGLNDYDVYALGLRRNCDARNGRLPKIGTRALTGVDPESVL